MFEARLDSCEKFKKILDAIKDLLITANFNCSASGIQLQVMDRNHVSLVSLSLRSEGFVSYRCDRDFSMCMDVETIVKIFKYYKENDKIIIKAEDNPDTVRFIFELQDEKKVFSYEVKLINTDQETFNIPEAQDACVIRMLSKEFARICFDLSQFGETMTIACDRNRVRFSTSDHSVTADAIFALNSVRIENQESVTKKFSCKYLKSLTIARDLSNHVRLSMSANGPLVVEYIIHDSNDRNVGYIRYYLAPKIDNEEN